MQCDLASEGFLGNINQLDEYCREKNFHAWFETSAKENIGIEEAARSLVAKVSAIVKPPHTLSVHNSCLRSVCIHDREYSCDSPPQTRLSCDMPSLKQVFNITIVIM